MATLHASTIRRLLAGTLLAVALASPLVAQPPDPIEALKKSLQFELEDERNPQAIAYRPQDFSHGMIRKQT